MPDETLRTIAVILQNALTENPESCKTSVANALAIVTKQLRPTPDFMRVLNIESDRFDVD